MSLINEYLKKNSFRNRLIESQPIQDLGIVVVVPAHDELELISSINSLHCCLKPKSTVEVIVVFNASENDDSTVIDTNQIAKYDLLKWFQELPSNNFQLHVIEENSLPKKHAGVGLARKIGMDEAARRLAVVGNENGIIVCYDADSKCEKNYLVEIEDHFLENEKTAACSIHFEHPIKGKDFNHEIYRGIYNYELHLRYYKNGLAYADLPYAFHTIGSSMVVRANAYCAQGGMNRRKAGEDFYFLQKFIDVGSLTELKTTKVIPSPRQSHRVPFGTGRAIQEMLDGEREIENSYAFECFETLKRCFVNAEHHFNQDLDLEPELEAFLGNEFWIEKRNEIRKQSTNSKRFKKRFFQWFNAFQTLKFIHFLRDKYYKNRELTVEVPKLLAALQKVESKDLLVQLREIDLL